MSDGCSRPAYVYQCSYENLVIGRPMFTFNKHKSEKALTTSQRTIILSIICKKSSTNLDNHSTSIKQFTALQEKCIGFQSA